MSVPLTLEEPALQFLDVSSAVLFLYDWILLLPVELEVVWSEKLRPLNVLKGPLAFVQPIEPNTCRILYNTSGWMYITGIALTEVVLTIRTCALWGKDIRLIAGVVIFFMGCWIPEFYIIHLFLDSQTYIPTPFPLFGCMILGGKPILFVEWVILIVYEAMILTLMLIPGVAFFRSGNRSALTTVVYRDGITYYLFLFGMSVTNLLTVLLLPRNLGNLFLPYQRVMHTLLTSRVILHMRSQARKPSTTSPLVINAT
ncbi:hypothetical protein BDP27DRAFT_1404087 [Rhodocollybia butyracea]|uniref:DUF6533 domain-containing protein n=1 Tax=Rhodocollybia butyracea TaxID=206335 RepID=A0A9P5PPD3_9AGAR|nr:hypothetical protein BDP27DRAFT_1404087 [Rhodocollybia butyracea]